MTVQEVTVVGVRYWADHVPQLAQFLTTEPSGVPDPSGVSASPENVLYLTDPAAWAGDQQGLHDGLQFALHDAPQSAAEPRTAPGAVAPVEHRLVYTVEEAAQLLGISRSFAYEAVQRGDIPSMRIGRRILVPKAALERFLGEVADTLGGGSQ